MQVLTALLIVAQQGKKDIPERDVHWGAPHTMAVTLREYQPFIMLAGAFYGALLLAEVVFTPPHVATAPAGLAFGLSAVLFLIATMANYVIGAARRDRHELLDWAEADVTDKPDGKTLEVKGMSPLPVKVSLDPGRVEMSDGGYRTVYLHGFVEIEKPMEETEWQAKLLGIVLIGARICRRFPIDKEDG